MNAIFEILNPTNTGNYNRAIGHALGLNEAVIYGALLSKCYYYETNEMIEDGWFYSTGDDLYESTCLTRRQQDKAIKSLVEAGLIFCELRGMPAKRFFAINENTEILKGIIAKGEEIMCEIKPSVKKQFSETSSKSYTEYNCGTSPEEYNSQSENCDNNAASSCFDKTSKQGSTKSKSLFRRFVEHTYKSKIKNKNSESQSIGNDGRIENSEREEYTALLKENISYDKLCEELNDDRPKIDDLLGIMVDTVCTTKPTIRVNSENKPSETVKSVFLKLNKENICSVIESVKNNTKPVRNMRSYLTTVLYNASSIISSQNWVGRDNYASKPKPSDAEFSSFDIDEVMEQIISAYK